MQYALRKMEYVYMPQHLWMKHGALNSFILESYDHVKIGRIPDFLVLTGFWLQQSLLGFLKNHLQIQAANPHSLGGCLGKDCSYVLPKDKKRMQNL